MSYVRLIYVLRLRGVFNIPELLVTFIFSIVCLLVPNTFELSYGQIMVIFLVRAVFWGPALIRGRLFDLSVHDPALIIGRRLFKARRL